MEQPIVRVGVRPTTKSRELGVEYPCHGDYTCTFCNRAWESVNAWRDFGQECDKCTGMIKAKDLKELYFYTSKACPFVWKNKFIKEGMKCKTCKTMHMPISRGKHYYEKARLRSMQPPSEDKDASLLKEQDCKDPLLLKNKYATFTRSLPNNEDVDGGHKCNLCEKCVKYRIPCFERPTRNDDDGITGSSIAAATATDFPPDIHIDQSNQPEVSTSVPLLQTYQWNKSTPDAPEESRSIHTNQYGSIFQDNKDRQLSSLSSSPENVVWFGRSISKNGLEDQRKRPRMAEGSFVQAEPSYQVLGPRPTLHPRPPQN